MPQSTDRPAILALGTAVPTHCAEQSTIAQWVMDAFAGQPAVQRLVRSLYAYSGIETRYTCTADYLQPVHESRFSPGLPLAETPTTAERMAIYERESAPLGLVAVHKALQQYAARSGRSVEAIRDSITHLIVVSCTGFFAPGLDFVLSQQLGLASTVQRTLIGFMGCSAAFNGLRSAASIVQAQPDARVLMVNVELCSLHGQPGIQRDDLVSTSLFADGAGACLVGMPDADEHGYLAIDGFHTSMKPDTQSAMVWQIGNHGFTLRLSPRVPDHLADVAPAALHTLFPNRTPGFWAIHPGGRAIVDRLAEIFRLPDAQVAASREVLRRYGNLSSATVLFVLQEIVRRLQAAGTDGLPTDMLPAHATGNGHSDRSVDAVESGATGQEELPGIAMAFGPGLVIEMARLRYVPSPAHVHANGAAPAMGERAVQQENGA
jgi:predicted naringenin-chalcone synthase